MAAILFIHIAATSIPYGRYMVQPYGSHIETIWQAYGFAICLPYGVLGANHMKPHMVAI